MITMQPLRWAALLFLAFFQLSPQQVAPDPEPFVVENLTPEQVQRFDAAEREFRAAQDKHDTELNKIRSEHGQSQKMMWGGMGCGWVTTVELKGKYALITRTYDSCVAYVMMNK